MDRLQHPPSHPNKPYLLPSHSGELWTIPTSNSVMRLLVTGKETANAFAVVSTGGTYDKPIGFHFHREAHDVFLCLRGSVAVWADERARVMGEGDFASVPPNTIHQYQITSSHSEFIGLIIPGGWEEFFRFIGEPYSGPLFPTTDKRNPFEVLIPKLIAATEKFDMVPVREKAHFDPQPWDPATDEKLPGRCERGGYFLRSGKGERWVVGGMVVRPLATRRESEGRFSIYEVQGSGLNAAESNVGKLKFENTHHALYVVDGSLRLEVDGKEEVATANETVFVPAGLTWSVKAESRFARWYVFANGGGIGEVLTGVGSAYEFPGVPDKAMGFEVGRVKGLEAELGFVIV
ncbi:RmlC-like cupin domain-containing protein [Cadophora sp. MPI-SDFR-AT-0126]|nr:RmlC-like cupin domain-containing protein [Leotiomycetes sp. MPI-SDFR-AT-0126]